MKPIGIKHAALMLTTCLLLAGCIPVKNVEKAWKDAKADETLVGIWVQNDGEGIVGFVNTDKGFLVSSGSSGLEGGCKSFTTNGHNYIIVAQFRAAILGFDNVEDDNKGGTLIRYKIDGDKLTLYTYSQEKLNAAVKDKKVAGEMDENNSASLSGLDAATIEWLGKIADEKEGWDVQEYKRKKVTGVSADLPRGGLPGTAGRLGRTQGAPRCPAA
ncbi:MAG: hypothetical protein KTR15_10510 [Phycisphaeraceae bacterium]|nr:hypothetical protein [Phycisphaeraceae bacterium]